MQAVPLLFLKMNAVCKYAAWAGELIVMVNVQIALMFREQRFNPLYLLWVFAEVGVYPGIRKLLL